MSKHRAPNRDERRGSIYLVVLVVVASVTTMILVGTSLRRTTAEQYRANDDRMRVRQGARSATEGALTLMNDKDTFMAMAKAGKVFKTTVGKSTISVSAVDKDSGKAVDDDTETMLVTAQAETTNARSLISFDIVVQSDFVSVLAEKGATSYLALDEEKDALVAVDQIGGIDGTYLKPGNAGRVDFPDGGVAPRVSSVSEYIEVPHDSSFETSNGTILIWARISDMSDSAAQALFSKEDNDTVDFDIAMYVQNSDIKLSINSNYSFLDRNYSYNIAAKNDKDWHHFAYSFGSRGTRIYVDGVRVVYDPTYTIGLSYSFLTFSERNNERWWLGARRNLSSPSAPMKGSLARFAFIPEQLDDSEIAELMAAQVDAVKLTPVEGSFARVVE